MNVSGAVVVIVVISEPVHVIVVPRYAFDAEVVRQFASGVIVALTLTPYMLLPGAAPVTNVIVKPVGVAVTPRSSAPIGSAVRPPIIVAVRGGSPASGAASAAAIVSTSLASAAIGWPPKPHRPQPHNATTSRARTPPSYAARERAAMSSDVRQRFRNSPAAPPASGFIPGGA